ncbi:MAG: hypothetical protein A4E52_00742 [Pelotomaculum sp. PtaB.Bin013]|nr:MAG: hypothetical protein A4E52_00742 [Pelotomaculum sp. PtaB.Bin013]
MFFFFDNSTTVKTLLLENLLYTKHLYDRGFDISRIGELERSIFADFLDILFDENVEWNYFEIEPPLGLEEMDEDDEERYLIEDYLSRDHAMVSIRMKELIELYGKLRPRHYRQLMEIAKKLGAPEGASFDDLNWLLFKEVDWLVEDGKKTGIILHFMDVNTDWDDPYCAGGYYKDFLEMWDKLQELKVEVEKNARINYHRNKGRRFRLGKGAERLLGKRKADRPVRDTTPCQRVA